MAFKDTKGEYEQLREQDRRKLAGYLSKYPGITKKLRVVSGARAGRGLTKYTSGGRMAPCDLSNQKWVELTDDFDFNCVVSLDMIEIDPQTGCTHFLPDRIGLYFEYKCGKLLYEIQIYTNINLPLDEADEEKEEKQRAYKEQKQIAQLVKEQYDTYCKKKEEEEKRHEETT